VPGDHDLLCGRGSHITLPIHNLYTTGLQLNFLCLSYRTRRSIHDELKYIEIVTLNADLITVSHGYVSLSVANKTKHFTTTINQL